MEPNEQESPVLRILLVEDNDHDRVAFARSMRQCEVPCSILETVRGADALPLLENPPGNFDLVVIDYNLPGDSGLQVGRAILERGIPVPIVILTGSGSEEIAAEALRIGVDDYIIKDPQEGYLNLLPIVLPEIVVCHRERQAKRKADLAVLEATKLTAQIIDGNSVPTFVIDHNHVVTHWNRACEAMTGMSAVRMIGTREQWRAFYATERPVMADLIVDGVMESEVDRYYHDKFRKSALLEDAYEAEDFFPAFGEDGRWLFFTAVPLRDTEGRIIGAIETLQDFTERRRAEEALKRSEESYRRLSLTDSLTGLYNRRHFHDQMHTETSRAIRYGHPLSLLILDLDNFKSFNDAFGHLVGDHVLTILADSIRNCFRQTDCGYRYGGEEFAALLPETALADALEVAERLRAMFADADLGLHGFPNLRGSVSIGVAQFKPDESITDFIHRADAAVYRAKDLGRNQVVAADADGVFSGEP